MADQPGRWRRLRDLGMEAGFREAGCSQNTITEILNYSRSVGERIQQTFWESGIVDRLSEIEDGRAVLLAVLGHGAFLSVKELWLTKSTIGDLDAKEAAALCVNLSSNPHIRMLVLDEQKVFGTPEGCSLLADALLNNASLQSLSLSKVNMGSGAVRCLMDGLQGTRTLEDLSIGYNPLMDAGVGFVAEMLSANGSLKRLYTYDTHSGRKGAESMASALEHNITLETLYFGGNPIEKDGMKRLLGPLSRGNGADASKNATLKELELSNITRENFCVESMAWMIRTNTTILSLGLASTTLFTEDWVDHIFPALKENETLKELDLRSCKGLTIDGVYGTFVELIKCSFSGLEEIELTGTDLEPFAAQVDEQLRLNSKYRAKQRSLPQWELVSGRGEDLAFPSCESAFWQTTEAQVHGASDIDSSHSKSTRTLSGLQRFLCLRTDGCDGSKRGCVGRSYCWICCCCCSTREPITVPKME